MKIPEQEKLLLAWQDFVKNGRVDLESIRPVVLESWKRCKSAQVNPFQKTVSQVLGKEELAERRVRNAALLEISLPIMEGLYRFVAGSGFVVTLADSSGCLLEVIGDPDVCESIARGNFVPGADWSETSAGTNSVGTALITGQPLQIFRYEHFCINSHRSTCSAAPIRDPQGKIIGVLDMTGSYEKVHPHTLGMVVAGANAIEKQLSMVMTWRERDKSNRLKITLMEAMSDCLVACNMDLTVSHISRTAVELMGLPPEKIIGKNVFHVLGEDNSDFCNLFKGKHFVTDSEIDLQLTRGKIKCIATSRPVKDGDGRCEGVIVVFNEITRAKRLVQQMTGAVARFTFDSIVGDSPAFLNTLSMAKTISGSDSTVLLLGESGTGKDIFAQAIHNASSRSKGPFVAINCAAIPRDLIATELFGYTEGAFTGAKRGGSPGKFELADRGTLFLDEIGEMPPELQSMLLRVLEQKTLTRVGGTGIIPVDVRIITATNKDLLNEVLNGNFRRDLYYRLNVVNIELIPLRERKEDIIPLALHFISHHSSRMMKGPLKLDRRVIELFESYSWPGNVRELQNVIERALHLARGDVLTEDLLPEEIRRNNRTPQICFAGDTRINDYEREIIQRLLKEHNRNISCVSNILGIARTTLYRKIKKYNL